MSTGAASAISEVSATVSGQVNPNGPATTYHFDSGTTTAYGSSTPDASAKAGNASVDASASLSGLSPGTTYHYRIEATSSAGTVTGADRTFTTLPAPPRTGPPSATTGGPSAISEVSATVSGQVNPNGLATFYHIDYGPTTAYRSLTPTANAVAGSTAVDFSAKLAGLRVGTTYHYRIVATNAAGTSFGAGRTFRTLPRLSTLLHGLARGYRIAAVVKGGLLLRVGCSQPCSIKGSLVISAGTAKALRFGKRPLVIAGASASLKRAGSLRMRLRLTSAAKRALRALAHRHSLGVTLRIVSTPAGGGPVLTFSKTLTFKS